MCDIFQFASLKSTDLACDTITAEQVDWFQLVVALAGVKELDVDTVRERWDSAISPGMAALAGTNFKHLQTLGFEHISTHHFTLLLGIKSLGDCVRAIQRAHSPIFADLSWGLPPVLVQYGSVELLRDQQKRLCERFRQGIAAGAPKDGAELKELLDYFLVEEEYPGMTHSWHVAAGGPKV